MSIVTVDRYRTLTRDNDSSDDDVQAVLAGAQSLVETYLHRYVEEEERTETLTVYPGGRVYPSATPITEVSADYEIDGSAIIGATPAFPDVWDTLSYVGNTATVTYTGGWTEETVPYPIELGIARVAQSLLALSGFETLDPSINSLSVEGYSITRQGLGSNSTGDQFADGLLKPWRKRLVS